MTAHQMQRNRKERSECTRDTEELEGTKRMHVRCRVTGANAVNAHQMQRNWRERRECTTETEELEGTKRMHVRCRGTLRNEEDAHQMLGKRGNEENSHQIQNYLME